MKRIFKTTMMFAAATLAFAGCTKENINDVTPDVSSDKIVVNGHTSTAMTRVEVNSSDDSSVSLNWSADDNIKIFEFLGEDYTTNESAEYAAVTATEFTANGKSADFTFELDPKTSTKYNYHAVYAKDLSSVSVNTKYFEFVLKVPAAQIPTQDFVDPASVILVSDVVETTEQGGSGDIQFSLKHAPAYAKMMLAMPEGETIVSVKFAANATKAASNKQGIAGNYWYYYNGTASEASQSSTSKFIDIAAPEDGFAKEGEKFAVWFSLIPQEITDFTVTVTTENATYTKNVAEALQDAPLAFTAGKAKSFSVDMTKDTQVEEPLDGDYVILAKYNNVFYAMANQSKTFNTNTNGLAPVAFYQYTGKENPTKQNPIYTNNQDLVWTIEISGTGYGIKNSNNEYIQFQGSNNSVSLTKENTTALSVSKNDNGTYKIISESAANTLLYRENSALFGFYSTNSSNSSNYPDLYILPVQYDTSLASIDLKGNELVTPAGAGETTSFDVEITPDTNVNVTAWNDYFETEACTWLTDLSYTSGKINYTAEKNETEDPRTAYIVISASVNDKTNRIVVSVIQQPAKAKTYTMVSSVSELTSGDYYMAAYSTVASTANNNSTWEEYPYHMLTATLATTGYKFTNNELTANNSNNYSSEDPIKVTIELISDNTYYVKYNGQYLYPKNYSANNNLAFRNDAFIWTAKDGSETNTKGNIVLTANDTFSSNVTCVGAGKADSKILRNYYGADLSKSEAKLQGGLVFFKEN